MSPSRILALVLVPLLWAGATNAQTLERDRRIEEEKREELTPTLETPSAVPVTPAVQPPREAPVPPPIAGLYFAMLAPKRVVFRYDAAKAIVVLMGVDEEYIDLTSQVDYLKRQGFLPKRTAQTFDPMQPLRRGEAAYLFYRALGMRGGIALHVFGPTERYAMKELVFQGFLAGGHVNDLLSGGEFVQLMSQAASYKAEQELKTRKP